MTNREIDALVAEKVMGWTALKVQRPFASETHLIAPGKPAEPHTVCEYLPDGKTVLPCLPSHHLPHYSTDIAAAWSVVEKLAVSEDPLFEDDKASVTQINAVIRMDDGKWLAHFDDSPAEYESYYERSTYKSDHSNHAIAETPALAICLAALKAVGVDVDAP